MIGSAAFSPAAEADPVAGDCPYLTKGAVEEAVGQRMGAPRIRPASPYPTCEFARTDGGYLATVRVLTTVDETAAVNAVDYYAPRDQSDPAVKPTGWSGGSLRLTAGHTAPAANSAAGGRYAVSKGPLVVVVDTNQEQTIYGRLLATAAIDSLKL